jgi:hypothetical protein
MVTTTKNTGCSRASQQSKVEAAKSAASTASLRKLSAENWDKYDKSQQTRRNYESCIQHGKTFLANCVATHHKTTDHEPDKLDTEVLAVAFDKPPNRHSVDALEMFITTKCIQEKCTKSTGSMIQAAFKWYWACMCISKPLSVPGHCKYSHLAPQIQGQGPVQWGVLMQQGDRHCLWVPSPFGRHPWTSPVNQNQGRATGTSAMHGHAEAMSLEDLTRLMEWSRTVCPESWSSVQVAPSPDTDEMTGLVAKHLFMCAYMSTAFTLWTR